MVQTKLVGGPNDGDIRRSPAWDKDFVDEIRVYDGVRNQKHIYSVKKPIDDVQTAVYTESIEATESDKKLGNMFGELSNDNN